MNFHNEPLTLREALREMEGYSIDRFLPETPERDMPLISWRKEDE